jgi:hypothetical protein
VRTSSAVAAVTMIVALGATGCAGTSAPTDVSAGVPSGSSLSSPIPFDLYTHCGIDELKLDDRYYEAVHPLSDGNGNPPKGWDNPVQKGTVQRVSVTEVEFRDRRGHRVLFRLRPQATAFTKICS